MYKLRDISPEEGRGSMKVLSSPRAKKKQLHPLQLGTSDFGHLKIYTCLDDLLVWGGKSRSVASDELTLCPQSLPVLEHTFRIELLLEGRVRLLVHLHGNSSLETFRSRRSSRYGAIGFRLRIAWRAELARVSLCADTLKAPC